MGGIKKGEVLYIGVQADSGECKRMVDGRVGGGTTGIDQGNIEIRKNGWIGKCVWDERIARCASSAVVVATDVEAARQRDR